MFPKVKGFFIGGKLQTGNLLNSLKRTAFTEERENLLKKKPFNVDNTLKNRLLFPYNPNSPKTPQVIKDLPETFNEKVVEHIDNQSVRKINQLCNLCLNQIQKMKEPSFTTVNVLDNYMNARGKILPRYKTKLCPKHQRKIRKAIINARQLGYLSYTKNVLLDKNS
ncbi:hypothetical protein MHBO_005309 [Bonamia ostreae]|uniref:Ribosomal protein S18 n=1 Tax=Bonamia ostreae TaxID=126728 RepID=A0ABV2AN68_9EUKA